MAQDNPSSTGFGTSSSSDRPGTKKGTSSSVIGTTSATEICGHCGQRLHQNRGLEEFLGRIGISEEMIDNLKTQMQDVDVEEYLNTAREYLKTAGDKVRNTSDKATKYAKENPGRVAAGVAILAVGAGLLINSLRDRD